MTGKNYVSGLIGEKIASDKMIKNGFTLLKQRYKTKFGEIDLIFKNETQKLLVFVEVKRRKNIYDYSEVITKKQWHRIYNTADNFIAENYDEYKDYSIRYDAFICFTKSKNTIHIENIFPKENK